MYRRRRDWNLGRRSLTRLLFLGTSTSRKITKVHRARYTLPLPSLDAGLLDDQGSDIIQDLYILFTLSTTCNTFSFIVATPMLKRTKLVIKKRKKKKRWGRMILTSTSSLLVCKVFHSRLKTKPLSSQTTKGH